MGDCHLPYAPEERFCKYPNPLWCPRCDPSPPRRRSRSETATESRRRISPIRCKEMKTLSPKKYPRSQEYENMELDVEEYWPREPHRHHVRSSQLCELPTTYISNNCQTSKPSAVEHVRMKEEARKGRRPREPRATHTYYDSQLSFDTSTYFDKVRDSTDLHERYLKEIEAVRARVAAWKGAPVSRLQERYAREIEAVRQRMEGCRAAKGALMAINQSELLPRPRKLVAVKTRKAAAKVKVKRAGVEAKVAGFAESDYSGSDESETEEGNGALEDDESESLSEPITNENNQNSEPELALLPQPESGGGDTLGWPVRPSLFPHVPPYIRFSTHDAEVPVRVPAGRRLFKWKLSPITPIVVRKTLANSGFAMVRSEFSRDSNQWLGTWGKHMKSPMFKTLKETQKLNHFPGTFHLGRKDRLWRNFQKHINKFGYKEFGFIPQTFVLPHELKLLKHNWECGGTEAWIIKPPASARGVGIKVINKWSHLPKKTSLVVQKYISNPYLINGSKFDLRLYVLVTSFNPLRIYLYPDGLARFASAKYSDDVKDLKDRYIHLTNYSINKLSSQYTANEDANACQGHKWTISKLLEYMAGTGVDTDALWRNLQQLVVKTMITGESPIQQLCDENMLSRYNCYELFGVDVLLDEHLKPWLLEVNISPSLHSASPLDAHVKGPLVRTLFDLAQFHFPPRLGQSVAGSPQCLEPKLYVNTLTRKEREKHNLFVQYERRGDYLEDILLELTGDDVRKLTQAEDELTVKGRFERIFPTSQTYRYLQFMETRYYNRLFDAWEVKYEKNRQAGVNRLRALCAEKVHLKVASASTLNKNSQNTSLGCVNLQPSKEGQSRPLIDILQEVTIESAPSCN